MSKEQLIKMLLAEEYFLEHWILQFNLYSDMSASCLGCYSMKKRLEWVKAELSKLKPDV